MEEIIDKIENGKLTMGEYVEIINAISERLDNQFFPDNEDVVTFKQAEIMSLLCDLSDELGNYDG